MAATGCLFTFYTLTPLHAGSGDSTGVVDLPVQREKHTEYPVVYSSSMKGSLKWFFHNDPNSEAIFGGEDERKGSGQMVFTDAKILLFPVRSSEGVFKWATCPFVLERLQRDLKFLGISLNTLTVNPKPTDAAGFGWKDIPKLLLEDFVIDVSNESSVMGTLFSQIKILLSSLEPAELEERFVLVSDNVFKTLVTTATQVIARNVLDETTKTSKNLWYEEVVPADAVFYTIMKPTYRDDGATLLNAFVAKVQDEIFQIGGNETIGYGFVKMSANLAAEASKIPSATVGKEASDATAK